LKINKTILETMIREELSKLMEGLTPAEHEDVLRDPQGFAKPLVSTDAKLREAFFFPMRLIGKASKSGQVFFKNYHIAKYDPDTLKQLKINLGRAIADIGLGGMTGDDVHFVETSDGQSWIRIGYFNPWGKKRGSNPPEYFLGGRSAPLVKRLAALDFAKTDSATGKQLYVARPMGAPALKKGTTRKAPPPRVKKPQSKSRSGGSTIGLSDLWKQTFGTLNPFRS
jgi:hypothetical protein